MLFDRRRAKHVSLPGERFSASYRFYIVDPKVRRVTEVTGKLIFGEKRPLKEKN